MPGVVARKIVNHPDPWLTIAEAARMIGGTRYLVLAHVARGRLTVQVVAGKTFVLRESVERMREDALDAVPG